MSEPENIRYKKEILNLKQLNAQLQEQNEELNNQIGKLQLMNMSNNNKNELINKSNLITQNKKILKANIEEVIYEEKLKLEKILKENENLKQNLKLYENKIKDNEIYIQKLQLNNEKLQKELLDFGKKHEAQDYIDKIRTKEQEISKINEQREKYSRDYDELCDKMEEVICENRVLRQIADVPENFGIDISKINLGDRIKIEDYKAKIRILQHDIDDLESERAQLKHRIQFLANSLQVNEPPFHLLTQEQKVEVARYAQSLYEGREDFQPEKYELVARLKEKDNQIRSLEEDLKNYKLGRKYPDSSQDSKLRAINPNANNNNQ